MWFSEQRTLTKQEVLPLAEKFADEAKQRICKHPKRVLLLPPDITRAHSGAGYITEHLYKIFSKDADVHLIPTLGQHIPHTPEQNRWMFGSVPEERIHKHDWRGGAKRIGEIPAGFVREATAAVRAAGASPLLENWEIPVALNAMLLDEHWDLILNIGHVVPHEVLGFANHNKNYFIGLGGKEMICASHLMAACCGIENNLGTLTTPLRACYNYAEEKYLKGLPDAYLQVVMAYEKEQLVHIGVFAGETVETYLGAAKLSQQHNITVVPPLKKVVAVMQGNEFYSTWVANKAVYRTRKAMADGGELLIIAPGLERFGEQPEIDAIIRKYGYTGTERIMKLYNECPADGDLKNFAVGTAHLIHGSPEGRFKITYAPGKMSKADIESVNFGYADYAETVKQYNPEVLQNGFDTMPDGEEIYFIDTPSAGLWSTKERLA
ncbi:MAG: lactate racemase domain-containing protein [Planctomycetaceae bacterium]|jgi:nickel-dependent lactate racemase|nr:lactate racemase domain-containing protein [Planctomycetaceae bacterium]